MADNRDDRISQSELDKLDAHARACIMRLRELEKLRTESKTKWPVSSHPSPAYSKPDHK